MALKISLKYRVIIKIIYCVGATLGLFLFNYKLTRKRVKTSKYLLIYHKILMIVLFTFGIKIVASFLMSTNFSTTSFSLNVHVFKNIMLMVVSFNAYYKIGSNHNDLNETINEIIEIIEWINKTNNNTVEMKKFWKILIKMCLIDNCLMIPIYIMFISIVGFNFLTILPELYLIVLEYVVIFVANSLLVGVVALEYMFYELNKMIKSTEKSFIMGNSYETRQLISNDELNNKLQSFSLVYSKISSCSKKVTNLFPSLSAVLLLYSLLNILLGILSFSKRFQDNVKNIKFLFLSISVFMENFFNLIYLIYICIGVEKEVSLKAR